MSTSLRNIVKAFCALLMASVSAELPCPLKLYSMPGSGRSCPSGKTQTVCGFSLAIENDTMLINLFGGDHCQYEDPLDLYQYQYQPDLPAGDCFYVSPIELRPGLPANTIKLSLVASRVFNRRKVPLFHSDTLSKSPTSEVGVATRCLVGLPLPDILPPVENSTVTPFSPFSFR